MFRGGVLRLVWSCVASAAGFVLVFSWVFGVGLVCSFWFFVWVLWYGVSWVFRSCV